MSRVGKLPIIVPNDIKVALKDNLIKISKGSDVVVTTDLWLLLEALSFDGIALDSLAALATKTDVCFLFITWRFSLSLFFLTGHFDCCDKDFWGIRHRKDGKAKLWTVLSFCRCCEVSVSAHQWRSSSWEDWKVPVNQEDWLRVIWKRVQCRR